MAFTDPGSSEPLKAAAHGLVLLFAAGCGAYNVIAYDRRRELHLAVNAIVYAALFLFEAVHVHNHVRR